MRDKPQEGWHDVYCSQCYELASTVSHYGGENKLDKCDWCDPQLCYECWRVREIEEEIAEIKRRNESTT